MHRYTIRFTSILAMTINLLFPGLNPGAESNAQPSPSVIHVDGAKLEFTPLDMGKGKASESDQLQLISKATATLTSEKALSVRRDTLPPGTYSLSVEKEGDKSYFLVIEASPAPEAPAGKTPSRRDAKKAPSSTIQGALEDKGSGPDEARTEPPAGTGEPGPGKEAAGSAPQRSTTRKKAPAAKKADGGDGAGPPVSRLKVPFTIGACERKGDNVLFGLAARNKGTRLRLTVRAGELEARATVRFGAGK